MTNPVTLSELEAALDDLLAQEAPPLLEDTDLTVQRLVRRAKVGPVRAVAMLEKWTQEGKTEYIGERREPRGHMVKAWRLKV